MNALSLLIHVSPARQQCGRVRVLVPDDLKHFEDLEGQLARGAQEYRCDPCGVVPLLHKHPFQDRNDEGKRLARPRLGSPQSVSPKEGMRQRLLLNGSQRRVVAALEAHLRPFAEWEVTKVCWEGVWNAFRLPPLEELHNVTVLLPCRLRAHFALFPLAHSLGVWHVLKFPTLY